jgi:SAM-dependent methyltransferase
MSTLLYRRDTCRLCEGRNLELVLPLAPTPLADAYVPAEYVDEVQEVYPLDAFLCHDCGHVQLLDVIDPEILFRKYLYTSAGSPGLVEHFRAFADDLFNRVSVPQGALIVDIGSNDGTLLKVCRDRGLRVLGVDPAEEIARQATESGVETLAAFFTSELATDIRTERGAAAVVTANNVFAHADDLADVAEGVRRLLAPDGVFVFEVSYVVDLVENMVFDFFYHEHLCYHSVKSLAAFLRLHGMELIDIERVATKGGSFRGTAQLAGGPREEAPSISRLIALEQSGGFDKAQRYKVFAADIDRAGQAVDELLRPLKSQGKRIAGYGASATATTLIYHFGLGPHLEFIADDNPDRQDLFSPGHHIPTRSPQDIYDREIDYVVILAWRFAQPIIEKHRPFRERGGHFLVPLPVARIA